MRWTEAEYAAYERQHGLVPTMPPAVSEKTLMSAIARLARERGWYWYHTWSSKRSPAGFPDGCLVHPTRRELPVYLVELKTDSGQVTLAQQAWLDALDGRQVVSGVWRPEDWSTIVERLSR